MLKTLLWIVTAPIWMPIAIIFIGVTALLVYVIGYSLLFLLGTGFFFLLYYFEILTL